MNFKRIIGAVAIMMCCSVTARAESPVDTYEAWSPHLKEYTAHVCEEYGVDYSMALAVIYNESRFESGLTHQNSNGTVDYGLMQVNEVNFDYLHKTLGINSMKELLNDEVGIRCGVQLLAYHKQFTGNDSTALLRYQIGAGKYKQYLATGRYTNQTHQRVLGYQSVYKNYITEQNSSEESKLEEFIKKDPLESILNMWAEMLT